MARPNTGAMPGKSGVKQSKSGAEVLRVFHVTSVLEDVSQGNPPRSSLSLQKKPPGGCGPIGEIRGALLGHRLCLPGEVV